MSGRPRVHLFFPFSSDIGGSQFRTLQIAEGLREYCDADATVWATSSRSPAGFRRQHGIRVHTPFDVFIRGSFVFVGCFWKPKRWLRACRPQRLSVVINTMDYDAFRGYLPLYRQIDPRVRLAFSAQIQRRVFGGGEGEIHLSPIDLERFRPAQRRQRAGFRIGRHSRDSPEKHQLLQDPELYELLAGEGVEVDLMGGEVLRPLLAERPGLRLGACGARDAAEYLRDLDCFFYRTGAFFETPGRVVLEAMASGLPVVVHRNGGYAEHIVHGDNGFLFDDQRDAIEILRRLRDDVELRRAVGARARATMEALFAPARLRAMYQSYL